MTLRYVVQRQINGHPFEQIGQAADPSDALGVAVKLAELHHAAQLDLEASAGSATPAQAVYRWRLVRVLDTEPDPDQLVAQFTLPWPAA
jgi:hypothetical protein